MSVSLRKINFPSVVSAAYRGNISSILARLLEWAAWIDRSPGAKVDLLAALSALITYIGGLTATVANAGTITVADGSGVSDATPVATVAAGAVTVVTLPGTDKLIKSTVQVPCPAPTGSRVTGYVFTVAAGVITAAVGY